MVSELDNYRSRIIELHRMVGEIIADLPSDALNWRPLPDSQEHAVNSLAVLAAHVAGAQHFWIAEVIGGYPPTRNRPAEFETVSASSEELVEILDAVGKETWEVLFKLKPGDLDETRQVENRVVAVRWALLHIVDHTALHLGHMQLTYQLWMGGKSLPSPFWYQRLAGQGKPR